LPQGIQAKKYRVINWAEYNDALRRRGDITIWFTVDAIEQWHPVKLGVSGRLQLYADHAIETAIHCSARLDRAGHSALHAHHWRLHEGARFETIKDRSVVQSVCTKYDDKPWDAGVGGNLKKVGIWAPFSQILIYSTTPA